MKFSFTELALAFNKGPSLSLPRVLAAAGWVVVTLLLVALSVDGFAFYHYGLGRGEPAAIERPAGAVEFDEKVLIAAAAKVEERRKTFEALADRPFGLPNPFR